MDLVTILRTLWQRPRAVALAALVACLVAMAMSYRISLPATLQSREHHVGVASLTALVDTPSSQVVDLGSETGSDIRTLAARASLLASLITSSPIKDEIAARAGIPARQFVAIQPASGVAGAPSAPVVSGSPISVTDPRVHLLRAVIPTLETGDNPIIAVSTQAPDAATAARIANVSITVLREHLQSVAGIDRVPGKRRLVVSQLGTAASATVTRGPSRTMAIAVALLVFVLGCASIVGISVLSSGWRRAAEAEGQTDAAADVPESATARLQSAEERSPSGQGDGPAEPAPTERADVVGLRGSGRT